MEGLENLDVLDDLESYLEDINGRLTISRMVNDSVIKGMVNAVREDADERIACRESEVKILKEKLQFYESGMCNKIEESEFATFSANELKQDAVEECLDNLKIAAEKQFQVLEGKFQDLKGYNLIHRQNSGVELAGQSGRIESDWVGVDQSFNCLRNIFKNVFVQVGNAKTSLCEWKKEKEFQDEIESMVIQTSFRSLLEESEAKLWDQRAQLCGIQSRNLVAKIQELSPLLHELEAISRALSCPEMGYLLPHGSHDGVEDCNDAKRKDHFHRNILSSHLSAPNTFWEANTKDEESKSTISETTENTQLKHMTKDELINYFKTEMTKMKRNHESAVQVKTEELFSLKREFLKERGPSFSLKKDKEFEAMKRMVLEVKAKLEDILTENEKLPVVYKNTEFISSLKGRIDTLVSENQHLKDVVANKIKEVKCLSSQVSNASEKMSLHSLVEANLLKQIMKLRSDIEDMKIEDSVREDIFKCILKELIAKINCEIEDSDMEFITALEICEIIFKEFVRDGKTIIKSGFEDSDMECIMMQEFSGIIFREAAKDTLSTFSLMKRKYEEENKQRVSLKASLLETDDALSSEIAENEQLKKEMLSLSASVAEKENIAVEMGSALMREKKHSDEISQELNMLRDKTSQQERLITENFQDSNSIRRELEKTSVQMHLYQEETRKLNQKLQLAKKDLMEANQERKLLHEIVQKKEYTLSEAKEMEQRQQIESLAFSIQRLFKEAADFEGKTVEVIEKNNKRLKLLQFQCDPLIHKASLFRRVKSTYKQRLDKRYSDLQKAEAEVDLLGDEVDVLLSLLEKIYIALDHYSPILQHYPGIMEILKLIKRELSGETIKAV